MRSLPENEETECCQAGDTEFLLEKEYFYPDASGVVLFKQTRSRGVVNGTKRIRKFARNTPGSPWDLPGAVIRRDGRMQPYIAGLLYNLPSLTADPASLFVTEGEKDADALTERGHVALTAHQGGAGWRPEQAAHFRGYRGAVTVVADRDGTGAWLAARTYDLLRGAGLAATDLRVVVSAYGAPGSGADAYDHLAAGFGVDEFVPVGLARLRRRALAHAAGAAEGGGVGGVAGHYHA